MGGPCKQVQNYAAGAHSNSRHSCDGLVFEQAHPPLLPPTCLPYVDPFASLEIRRGTARSSYTRVSRSFFARSAHAQRGLIVARGRHTRRRKACSFVYHVMQTKREACSWYLTKCEQTRSKLS